MFNPKTQFDPATPILLWLLAGYNDLRGKEILPIGCGNQWARHQEKMPQASDPTVSVATTADLAAFHPSVADVIITTPAVRQFIQT